MLKWTATIGAAFRSPLRGLYCASAAALCLAAATPAMAQAPVEVSIGISSGSIPASVARVAAEMGFFEKHGVKASVTLLQNASTATSALIAGSLDFISTSYPEPILANLRGQDLVSVAVLYGGYSPVLVLSKKVVDKVGISADAPIEERLKALNGLLIASVSATSSYTIGAQCAAELGGGTIRLTFLDQPSMVSALSAEAIEGFVAGAPFYAISELSGDGVPWINGPKNEFPRECSIDYVAGLHTTRAYAERNPEAIKGIRAALADFSNTVKTEPDTVKAALMRLYPDISADLMTTIFETEVHGFAGADLNVDGLKREIEFMKKGGAPVAGLDDYDPARLLVP